jgi:hypothetical protein
MNEVLKTSAVAVQGRTYIVRFFGERTTRGQCRYSAEMVLGPDDRVILDDDSLAKLEFRTLRLAPATVYSHMLARATAA